MVAPTLTFSTLTIRYRNSYIQNEAILFAEITLARQFQISGDHKFRPYENLITHIDRFTYYPDCTRKRTIYLLE